MSVVAEVCARRRGQQRRASGPLDCPRALGRICALGPRARVIRPATARSAWLRIASSRDVGRGCHSSLC